MLNDEDETVLCERCDKRGNVYEIKHEWCEEHAGENRNQVIKGVMNKELRLNSKLSSAVVDCKTVRESRVLGVESVERLGTVKVHGEIFLPLKEIY